MSAVAAAISRSAARMQRRHNAAAACHCTQRAAVATNCARLRACVCRAADDSSAARGARSSAWGAVNKHGLRKRQRALRFAPRRRSATSKHLRRRCNTFSEACFYVARRWGLRRLKGACC